MRNYSAEEKSTAKKALPEKLVEFVDSEGVAATYAEIAKTFKLNLRQTAALIEVTELTLIGLEGESDFSNNIREALPEISVDLFHELVEYVNEHIFSEAKRLVLASRRPPEKESQAL